MSYAEEMIEAAIWGGNEKCQACDMYADVNDISLCEDCDEKVQRDLIRDKDWDYVVVAFGLDDDGRKKLYQDIIKRYGKNKEII